METSITVPGRDRQGTEFQVTIKNVGSVAAESVEYKAFYNRIMNNLQRQLGLQMLGRRFYNSALARRVPEHGIEV